MFHVSHYQLNVTRETSEDGNFVRVKDKKVARGKTLC
jgi:hypothetical protein